jgi:hypothetical protein
VAERSFSVAIIIPSTSSSSSGVHSTMPTLQTKFYDSSNSQPVLFVQEKENS